MKEAETEGGKNREKERKADSAPPPLCNHGGEDTGGAERQRRAYASIFASAARPIQSCQHEKVTPEAFRHLCHLLRSERVGLMAETAACESGSSDARALT